MISFSRLHIFLFPLMTAFAVLITSPVFAVTLPAVDKALPALVSSGADSAIPVAANTGKVAQDMIDNLGKRAMAAIQDSAMDAAAKKNLFKQLLSQHFDMATIGRFAMGRFWRVATPAQQSQFLGLYERMVIDVYTSRFQNYSGQKFTVTGNRIDESGDAVVNSQITGSGSPVIVDWRVRNKGGTPKIIDVMVEGVSMAVTQRNDFAGIIQKGGGQVDALLDYLKRGGTSDVSK